MLISVHIPKTAGRSFGASLRTVFKERLLFEYTSQPLSSYMSDRINRLKHTLRLLGRARKIVRDYDVIHGHFTADSFNLLPCPKQYAVFLRSPVDRVISHYLFWKAHYSRYEAEGRKLPSHSLLEYTIRNRVGLTDFAATPEMVNLYSIFLGRMSVEQIDFIGLMEEYGTSLRLFEKIFGIRLEETRKNITNRDKYANILTGADSALLRQTQQANQEIYDRCRRRFDQLCSRYL